MNETLFDKDKEEVDAQKVIDGVMTDLTSDLVEEAKEVVDNWLFVKLTAPQFSKSKGLTSEEKARFAEDMGVVKMDGGGVQLYDNDHAAVKNANDTLSAAKHFFHSKSRILADSLDPERVEAGTRRVRTEDWAKFEAELQDQLSQVKTAESRLNYEREGVLAAAKEFRGPKFSISDYAKKFHLRLEWRVKKLPEVEAMLALNRLVPGLGNRMVKEVINDSRSARALFVKGVLRDLLDKVSTFAEKLEPRVFLWPNRLHDLHLLSGCEVMGQVREAQDESVSEGHVKFTLRMPAAKEKKFGKMELDDVQKAGDLLLEQGWILQEDREKIDEQVEAFVKATKSKGRAIDVDIQPVVDADLKELQPREDSAKSHTLTQSLVENLKYQIEYTKDQADPQDLDPETEETIEELSQILTELGETKGALKQLKAGAMVRNLTRDKFLDTVNRLVSHVETHEKKKRKLLKI